MCEDYTLCEGNDFPHVVFRDFLGSQDSGGSKKTVGPEVRGQKEKELQGAQRSEDSDRTWWMSKRWWDPKDLNCVRRGKIGAVETSQFLIHTASQDNQGVEDMSFSRSIPANMWRQLELEYNHFCKLWWNNGPSHWSLHQLSIYCPWTPYPLFNTCSVVMDGAL